LPLTYYRGCWHVISRGLFLGYRQYSSPRKEFYDPKAFITHAALLHQAFAHCAIFPTAASRRSLDRVSVPVWPIAIDRSLGKPLPYQLANLTRVHPVPPEFLPLYHAVVWSYEALIIVSNGYSSVQGRLPTRYSPVRRFPGRLPTRYSPVRRFPVDHSSEESVTTFSLDLHVLGTPPAFILSQDQTLK